MKKILIVSPYYNNPHFIEYQINSFNKTIKEPYDFIILDDAKKDTKCLLKDCSANLEIQRECKRFNIKYIKVDEDIHKGNTVEYDPIFGYTKLIGTPKIPGASMNHGRVLNWFMTNILTEDYYKKYKTMLIIDSDVFILKKISLDNLLGSHCVCSPKPVVNHGFTFPDVGFFLINMEIIPYKHIVEMNFLIYNPHNLLGIYHNGRNCYFDTGSCLNVFFNKYPQYKNNMKFLEGKLQGHGCSPLYHVYCGSKHNVHGNNYDAKMRQLRIVLKRNRII